MAATFNDLPQELCNRIIRFFRSDPDTLLRLCLTSVRFVDEARSYLYAVISVCNSTYRLNITSAKSVKLLSTFKIHNPSLAKYVKFFIYNAIALEGDDPVYEDLRHAFRLMVNVTWLEIMTKIPYRLEGFFDGCSFHQLQHFRCKFATSDRMAIYKLLSTQSSLLSLYMDGVPQDFPSDCCINLQRLIVSWRNVAQVLPGRSILGLELFDVEPFVNPATSPITAQLGNLTHLTFQSDAAGDFLGSVAPYLTNLTVLRIIARDDGSPTAQPIIANPKNLCKLTNLEIFVWSQDYSETYHQSFDPISVEIINLTEVLVDMWFQDMPKLAVIYSREYGYARDYYSCWRRDKGPKWVVPKVALGGKHFYDDE